MIDWTQPGAAESLALSREPLRAVIQPETILEMRALVDQVHVDEQIEDYIVRLVFATREPARFVRRSRRRERSADCAPCCRP